MKKLILVIGLFLLGFRCYAKPATGNEILDIVRANLPSDPIRLIGTLKTTSQGRIQAKLPIEIELNWKGETPAAVYRIGKRGSSEYQSLTIVWKQNKPSYIFSDPENKPTALIPNTGISWSDLSVSMLWRSNAELIREEKKHNQKCYVLKVPDSKSQNNMLLWIDQKQGSLIEAQTLDENQQELRRMVVLRTEEKNDQQLILNTEFYNRELNNRTRLSISTLEWPARQPLKIFIPSDAVNIPAFDLYKKFATGNDANLCFSPYSISSALAMIVAGARGETAEQIYKVFHFDDSLDRPAAIALLQNTFEKIEQNGHVQLDSANALWLQENFDVYLEYLDLTQNHCGAELYFVDYITDTDEARHQINRWVEEKTHEKIRDLLGEGTLSSSNRLTLVNALYFNADWASPFETHSTRPESFHLTDGTTKQVPMMAQSERFGFYEEPQFKVLELPYRGLELSMLILLPTGTNTLNALEKNLSAHTLNRLILKEQEVIVRIPKFKIESDFELQNVLSEIGMPLAFDQQQADFSGISSEEPLWIDSAIHKTFINVTERGTEAAAATAIRYLYAGGSTAEPREFVADRPFLFCIRENSTGTLLFMGRVMNPEA
ncbi:MAG: outer membrane lipoprotein-sorting protein [Pontiellaceae bacterium]|nr:outer membrane lipoprotein-sorting protein [Pontiellaceae bacterium]